MKTYQAKYGHYVKWTNEIKKLGNVSSRLSCYAGG